MKMAVLITFAISALCQAGEPSKTVVRQPCQADFGTEFGTRLRPIPTNYVLAPKPRYKAMPPVPPPEKKPRPGTQSKPASRKHKC